ncbi:SUMF1/EgtB/PvdO family nonheme iron enzyme [Nostoc sp.]|uniref:SUMF1/EgtB/PvdO family nonheme iron enzyme n=1 Tax=Nostoc sp. TaxID=1180 RepID=UPI002FF833E0
MSEPPLLNLFLRLRETGLPLGIDQYYLAVEALLQSIEAGLDIADKQAVARLCQTIWVKSRQQQRLFDQCWNEMISHPARLSKSPIIEPPIPEDTALSKTSSPENSKPPSAIDEHPNQPEKEPELLIPTPSDEAIVKAVSTKLKEGDYFPVRREQLQRGWRLLTQKLPSSIPSQIDIRETVTDVAKRGFFLKPVLTAPKIQYREVVLLIDQEGSMVPFHPFCRQLVKIWQGAKIYYFRNSPTEELYYDSQCWQGESIKSILSRFSQKKTLVVVIVSDAGAARRRTVPSRWEETVDFLAMLIPRVNRVAWLNPLPRFHWRDTTAKFIAEISSLVPMFALESAEYGQMLQWLFDGKPSIRNFLKQAENKASKKEQFGSFNIWEIEEYNAKGQIEAFGIMFREAHLNFAYHAAFSLVLTPNLLYCLWWKFFKESETPWYVVADLLLSDLCREVDTELYEMEREVRNELLRLCQEQFGEQRLQELSQFLIEYINRQVKKHQPDSLSSDLLQVQQWTALAYIKKGDEAAKELAEKLRQAYLENNKAELVRLAEVIETLAEPLREKYEPLLVVAKIYGALVRGDEAGKVAAQNQLKQLGFGESVNVQGVVLERPDILGEIHTYPFSFEVVTVNRRGQIIKQVTKQARYFTEYLDDNINLEMVAIPGGKFKMGSPDGEGDEDEHPQHDVTVQPFFMGKYPVTQAQWRVVAKLPKIERDLKPDPSHFKGNDLPVECVSWYDAEEFCNRLSEKSRRQYRLPSEAEWEYACSADTTTPFHFGETITGKLANYNASKTFRDEPKGEHRKKTTSVKTFTPNAFGLFDMHGNVWEWCADVWQDNYKDAPNDGSKQITLLDNNKDYRVLRGGSWGNNPEDCRYADRGMGKPNSFNFLYSCGFRLVYAAVVREL